MTKEAFVILRANFARWRGRRRRGRRQAMKGRRSFFLPPSARATYFFWGKENGEYGRGGEGRRRHRKAAFFSLLRWYAGKKHFSEGFRSTSYKRGRLRVSHATDSLRSVILLSPSEVLFLRKRCHLFLAVFFPLHCMRAFKSGVANKSSLDDQRELLALNSVSFAA